MVRGKYPNQFDNKNTFNKEEYINKVSLMTEEDVIKELKVLMAKDYYDKHYDSMLPTGGIQYVLREIASDLYFECKCLDGVLRYKLSILDLGTSLYSDNSVYQNYEKTRRYYYGEKELLEKRNNFIIKSKELF